MRRVALAGVLILAIVAASGGMAGAAAGGVARAATTVPGPCAPNPAPAPRGERTVSASSPSSGQAVSSAITVRGTANPGSTFRAVLYDADGVELSAINVGPVNGPEFTIAVPYRLAEERGGCLWLFNTTGPNWTGNPINVVQTRLILRANVGVCYAEAGGVCADDHFQRFWSGNGGLPQFGYPLAPAAIERTGDGKLRLVQWFERARFEYHPEIGGTTRDVLLGLLGNELTAARRAAGEAPFSPRARPADCAPDAPECAVGSSRWFAATGQALGGAAAQGDGAGAVAGAAIADQWLNRGGLPVYGYPISAVFRERGYDGNDYFVQYFERHRLEYHPENAPPYTILLGQLGRQLYEERGGGR